MDDRRDGSSPRDISGIFAQILIHYLESRAPEGSVERVLETAGETRTVAELCDQWSTYGQYRKLFEAAGELLGGLDALASVGRQVYDSIRSPELVAAGSTLLSPIDVYANIPMYLESIAPIVEYRTESIGPNECRVSIGFKDGYEPFPENCAFHRGLFSAVPKLVGYERAEVLKESCQCDGAPFCQFIMRWESLDDSAIRVSRAELAARVSRARLEELQHTVAELVSGDSLDTVLTQVMAAASRSVPALSYILAVTPSTWVDRWLRIEGLDALEAAVILDCAESLSISESPHICALKVLSDRNEYGYLVAVRVNGGSFEPFERSILESYARLAAGALDSDESISEARRQASTAQALLALSSSLADIGSTDEMMLQLVRAVPEVIDCDRVVVWLTGPDGASAHVCATFGFDSSSETALRAMDIPLTPGVGVLHHRIDSDRSTSPWAQATVDSRAALSFPITYDNEMYGRIGVDVTNHPERLDDSPDIAERLSGLAGQAAMAIRNSRLLDEIRHQALHDGLTGLPNRVLVVDRVNQTLARARRERLEVALLFIDLDGFKAVNDTMGHAMGDKLLQAVAARFSGTLRETDTVARLGGDEFVVLAEGLSLAAGPELVAERLLDVLAEPFDLDDAHETPIHVSASIGIAVGLRDSADTLLRDADIALYAAKDAGKGCYVIFEAEMQEVVHTRHELELDLQAAIGTDQFFLVYQPIFKLDDRSVVGVEALLRWNHPTRGLLQPDEFIPTLEVSGLIMPVGRWALHEACRQAMVWRQQGRAIKMSVNASARQFDADAFQDDVKDALAASGLPPGDLIIEITETSLMRDTTSAHKQLTALKALGVKLAIDDFGTGYSSLSYLQQFPVDSLKIDRSFINGMAKTPEGDALIHTLMQLGKALHLETLAEGIEEDGQLRQLQFEDCDVGQGFFFARPLSPEDVEAYLTKSADPTVV